MKSHVHRPSHLRTALEVVAEALAFLLFLAAWFIGFLVLGAGLAK